MAILDVEQFKETLKRELPALLQQDPDLRAYLLDLARDRFADKRETEDRFDRLLNELARDREEQSRKWEAQQRLWQENDRKWQEYLAQQDAKSQENDRKWQEYLAQQDAKSQENDRKWQEYLAQQDAKSQENDRKWQEYLAQQDAKWQENDRKWQEYLAQQDAKWQENDRKWQEYLAKQDALWEEQNHKWWENMRRFDAVEERMDAMDKKWQERFDKVHEEIMAQAKRFERSIGALGARWGVQSERTFRNALASILQETFGVEVLNITEYDDDGVVFGRPEQIELDIIIQNGVLLILELKSSIDKAGLYAFERKARFYERRHQRTANRLIVISPMVDPRATGIAEKLGIEVFSDALDVTTL